jgi:hypothetical protein
VRRRPRPASTRLIAVADGGQRLSEGLVVEASVVARLFRMRLLEVDASLVVAPAQVEGQSRTAHGRSDAGGRAIGAGLAAAEDYLSEGAASLARSRR